MKVALLDLGTNSVRLYIYEISNSKVRLRHEERAMVRLGDSVFEKGELSANAIRRTEDALVRFRRTMDEHKVDRIRAVATSAIRSARDGNRFLRSIEKRFGFKIEAISGEEEARLIAKGVLEHIDIPGKPLILIDLGGGSTEISLCTGKKVHYSMSLQIGAAKGQQLFLKSIPPVNGNQQGELKLRNQVRSLLEAHRHNLPFNQVEQAIGSSGSIRAFRRIQRARHKSGAGFSIDFLFALINEMRVMRRSELEKLPGLDPKRVDLVLSAAIILEEILRFFYVRELRVTSYALKDGLLHELMSKAA